MASLNPLTRELVFKIVFYGPGLGGKTTTLQYIHATTKPEHRGKMVSLATPTDRTLYFDFLPLRVPRVRGMSVRLQLFTVPGQVYYSATRKLVLSGADGVVFVADSQAGRMDANQESLEDLNANLAEHNRTLVQMPHTFHWNKRDLSDLVPVEELDRRFNVHGAPSLGTCATRGDGVFEGLERITRLVLRHYESELPKHEQPILGLSSSGGEISIAEAIRGLAEAPLVSKVTPFAGMPAVRPENGATSAQPPASGPRDDLALEGGAHDAGALDPEAHERGAHERGPHERGAQEGARQEDAATSPLTASMRAAHAFAVSPAGGPGMTAIPPAAVPPPPAALPSPPPSVPRFPSPPSSPAVSPGSTPSPGSSAGSAAARGATEPMSAPHAHATPPAPPPIPAEAAPSLVPPRDDDSDGKVAAAAAVMPPAPAAPATAANAPHAGGTPTIAPPPGTSHFSMAELWPEGDRENVRQTETLIGARDAHGAVLACDVLLTRVLASAAALAGPADAPRDPGLVSLLLGLDGRRYLAFRAAVRAARQKEEVSVRDALECFAFVLEARGAREGFRR